MSVESKLRHAALNHLSACARVYLTAEGQLCSFSYQVLTVCVCVSVRNRLQSCYATCVLQYPMRFVVSKTKVVYLEFLFAQRGYKL